MNPLITITGAGGNAGQAVARLAAAASLDGIAEETTSDNNFCERGGASTGGHQHTNCDKYTDRYANQYRNEHGDRYANENRNQHGN